MDEQQIRKFDGIEWAIVEVMGHNTYAGQISQVVLGNSVMIRVDVPEISILTFTTNGKKKVKKRPGFTKLIGSASIYAITPCDETAAKAAAGALRSAAVSVVSLPTHHLPEPEAVEGDW